MQHQSSKHSPIVLMGERAQIIQDIIAFVESNPGMYRSKVRALFSLKCSRTKRTVDEYISILLDAEKLVEADRRLYVIHPETIYPLQKDLR